MPVTPDDLRFGSPGRRESIALAILVAGFTVIYCLIGLFRHWHFRSSAYDLGIFDQAVWHLSRFEQPASSIRGVSNIFGDHFHPILAVFAALYQVAPAPETLIVSQALLFGISIVPVFHFLRDRLPAGPSLALCGAYGLFWGLQRAAAFDVHEIAFAPALIAALILAMDRRRWRWFWAAAVLLMLVKEDLFAFLTFVALLLLARGDRRVGTILLAMSLTMFVLVVRVLIPALSDSGAYGYAGSFADVLRRPWKLPFALVTPVMKLQTAVLWLAPFAFLSLASPVSFLLAPFVLTRFLSDAPNHWGLAFHYSAPLAPVVAMSAGDGLARLARRLDTPRKRARLLNGFAAGCVILSAVLPGNQPHWDLFKPEHYQRTAAQQTGFRVVQLIPDGAAVVAQAAVVPHLSQRDRIYMLDAGAPEADYVITAAHLSPWPLSTCADVERLLDERRARGYKSVFQENGWTVLRRH